MNFEKFLLTLHPHLSLRSAEAVLRLVSEGGTVPFISRYRKEQTGNLDEVGVQAIIDTHEKWESILKRQSFIVEEIERQKKMTPELKEKILSAFQAEVLEDLYLPYKLKRKTKAVIAKEAGLEPLADWIWNLGHGLDSLKSGETLETHAALFLNEEKNIKEISTALEGAQDILTERLSEQQELRQQVRQILFEKGFLRTGKAAKAKSHSKFESYFDHQESITSLLKPQNSHRYLAIRRGWMEEEITLSLGGKLDTEGKDGGYADTLTRLFEFTACPLTDTPGATILLKAARLALKAHVLPSLEAEVHKALKEVADTAAIEVFAENVRKLLLASPFGPKTVLGVDPGIRTGCKIALVDHSGKYLASHVMHLQTDSERKQAQKLLAHLAEQASLRAIAVGNGTAGRETETYIRQALKEAGFPQIPVVMVNESGASVYSASEAAREEFPDLDLTVRGAISIARRLQDPLAELVKVDPKSIGVGQYQHDVAEHSLKKSLALVVDSCVNQVGVNLNTASYHLLSHVAGIGPSLAKAMVDHRNKKGLFHSRQELLEIPRFTKKTFEQAAGFLRIPEASNPLDNTGVHPEQYPLLESLAAHLGKKIEDLMGAGVSLVRKNQDFAKQVGNFTFEDMTRELEKPGRDPRDSFVPFHYREDIHEVKDLQAGMICPGIVTNVTNFGAFVDIGVHQDGLVHISQMADHFVKDPRTVVSPGDAVQIRVLEINLEKNQIALSMRLQEKNPETQNQKENSAPHSFKNQKNAFPPPKNKTNPPPTKTVFNSAFAGLADLKIKNT